MNIRNRIAAGLTVAACSPFVLAQATPPPVPDLTTSLQAFKTDVGTFVSTNGPAMLGVVLAVISLGIAIRFVTRMGRKIGG